ncbi:hypothetical protein SAMN05660909_04470 [Chitinophaga terrae (ex Kim and Jung 2007)]|uniref:Uncharacterized protein n=1 Tax=Chitinophaga terrae (ex Kim and Jung 2007) TaxID=408074 RepID=A0A1H4FJS3_9BACT|nr:hypothetical protein [Chitinophaga terrae (ex Kim and Jung 2007)]GEP92453.1 hypothetical protein CTE07_40980 [Chitinophaga terrae (ex Kim and Jung 2007)]SEA97525.1 hypothetical protein SAMN05660909_04470 [Chitinophaga terrae (ex Kim and Jung 2007)]
MKYLFYLLTTAIFLSSCSNDPEVTSIPMTRLEKLCNNPWGNADTTHSFTIRKWLDANQVRYESAEIYSDTVSQAIVNSHNCDTLTGRMVTALILFSDTAKARQLGLSRY